MTSPRRKRYWVNSGFDSTLLTGGVPGQLAVNLNTNLEQRLGLLSLAGFTVSRTHICSLITSGGSETGTGRFSIFLAIGVFTAGIDVQDFPDISTYDGDWLAWECYTFQLPGAVALPVLPDEAAFQRSDYRSMRKIPKSTDQLFLVIQIDSTPSSAVVIKGEVASLFLAP